MSVKIFVQGKWIQLPLSNVILDGSIDFATVAVSSSMNIDDSSYILLCDATSGVMTVTLPASSSIGGRNYYVKKIDSSGNNVIVDGNGGETIDGATTYNVASQYDSVHIVSDNSNWYTL